MTIGVVIPTLNEETVLADTLANLRARHVNEIIVVDGGSRDRTRAIAESVAATDESPRVTVLASPPGRARQMNAGGFSATSDVLIFLHADTVLPPTAREAIESALVANARYVAGRFDVRFEQDRGLAWIISRMINWRSRWSGIFTGDQAMFIRRDTFRTLRGFSDIPLMEDIEFSKRLKRAGDVAALRATVTTSFRRWERSGPVRTILRMWTLRFLYWLGISPQTLQRHYEAVR